jgi:hypothetical protein
MVYKKFELISMHAIWYMTPLTMCVWYPTYFAGLQFLPTSPPAMSLKKMLKY